MKLHQAVPRFCVVSSNRFARKYLSYLLSKDGEFSPVSTEELTERHSGVENPVFVVDCTFLTLPLTEFISRMKSKFATASYVVIDKDKTESEIRLLLSQGVQGFVAEHQIEELLALAVRTVLAGGLWIPEKVLQSQLRSHAAPSSVRARAIDVNATTQRETEVLELVRRRLSNKEIAELLQIRESTVKYHVSNLFSKLQVTSRYELAQSNSNGMLEPLAQLI
jgi:DNA-binding NarL/FixJ family response regulator